jgi:hypothetical protein
MILTIIWNGKSQIILELGVVRRLRRFLEIIFENTSKVSIQQQFSCRSSGIIILRRFCFLILILTSLGVKKEK